MRFQLKAVFDAIAGWKAITWALLGFSVSYAFFFIKPIFFSPVEAMQFFHYIPILEKYGIGADLRTTLGYSALWFGDAQSPYLGGGAFPPLAHVFFAPLLPLAFPVAYKIFTFITLLSFVLITWIIPTRYARDESKHPLILLIFITGLLSYGLQFELERGQFSVIAIAFCLLSIYLFHYHPRLRLLAYLLFTVSIQLKIFPAIFVVLFVSDWKDWKSNLKRGLGLFAFNFAALFVLGGEIFSDFLKAMTRIQLVDQQAWIGNHSIASFSTLYAEKLTLVLPWLSRWIWLRENAWILEYSLLFFAAANFLIVLWVAYTENKPELNAFLLLSGTLLTLLIPSVSHDYRLSILPAALALALPGIKISGFERQVRLLVALIVLLIAMAYSSTLFSYTNRPGYLFNNLPALMTILLLTTVTAVFQKKYTFRQTP